MSNSGLNLAICVGFVLFFALAIFGRRLRENAFRSLSNDQRALVVDKCQITPQRK
jgi:hypothetical protein